MRKLMHLKSQVLCYCLLVLTAAVFAQPASHSAFFVANEGQWPGEFAFRYDGGGGSWFVTKDGLTIDLRQYDRSSWLDTHLDRDPFEDRKQELRMVKGHVLKVGLVNGNRETVIEGSEKLASYSNYFLGQDKSKWRSRVGHYRKVVAQNVWPGIDVEYRAEPQGVEMVFRVQPGADIDQIQVEYEGLDAPLSVDSKGNLVLKTSLGNLIENAPFAYQIEQRRQREVPVRYTLTDQGYHLVADNYDHSRELVIDPLLYGTYLGADGLEDASDVAVASNGEFVVCGSCYDEDFPVTPGAYQDQAIGPHGYLARFNADGSDLIFASYLGSPYPAQGWDANIRSVIIDNFGRVVCGGYTQELDWPVTENAFQGSIATATHNDAVLNILSADGSELVYGTYMGSSYTDNCNDIIYDGDSLIYCCGAAGGGEIVFPVTPDAIFSEPGIGGNAYLLRFNIVTFTLEYSTLLAVNEPNHLTPACLHLVAPGIIWMSGGTPATDLPVTPNAIQPERGNPNGGLLTDGFITRWDLNSNELTYCSYWGGSSHDGISGLVELTDSLIVMGGGTLSLDFPVTDSTFETVRPDSIESSACFISIMNPYAELIASTYFGVNCIYMVFNELWVDSSGISFFGLVRGFDLPITANAFDTLWNNGLSDEGDSFVARLSPDLRELEYGSYLGGAGYENFLGGCFDHNGQAWICGKTYSGDLPTTEGAFDRTVDGNGNAFVIHFSIPDVVNAAEIRPYVPLRLDLTVFPNPFNPTTTISFTLPRQAQTSLEVFNVLGQAVYTIDLGQLPAGEYHHLLDTASLPSGTYLTRLNAGDVQEVKKMALVR